jgi:hypothetical protein
MSLLSSQSVYGGIHEDEEDLAGSVGGVPMTLVIVESPNKCAKIKSYLGDRYVVKASCGHIRDLAEGLQSIEIDNNFAPRY